MERTLRRLRVAGHRHPGQTGVLLTLGLYLVALALIGGAMAAAG